MSTHIDEVGDGIYRIHTALPPAVVPGGFSFNQYLVVDDEPLLFHTGPRSIFAGVHAAIAKVMPIERLRHLAFSHYEADECGAMNELLALAPGATPLASRTHAMINSDVFDRRPRAIADGETLTTGKRHFRWIDTPHVPHAWERGYLFEETTRTLLCGDLFTQGGSGDAPIVESDILGPSTGFAKMMDYWAHAPTTGAIIERLAALEPTTLACMHGHAWRGDGAKLLRGLADSVRA
jgi:flavorubredoxin